VLEAIFAAYESARTGQKVQLPFKTDAKKPHDLWKAALTAMPSGRGREIRRS